MDRYNRDRDNAPSGRQLHTYTPRSHEDLLRSHLQLDASRNARLQNELQRLADENKRLRRDLDDAQKDLKDKDEEIDDLRNKLREKPKAAPPPERSSIPDSTRVFEIDGKPVTLDQILNHFDGVIQKHHDLLDKKNRQINDLEDALRNRPKQVPKQIRNAETQAAPREDNKQADFAKELALIRKEYEQVENILTDRNNKLENLIDELKRKLGQYADEIGQLRKELAARETDPNESTIKLLKEKEKENDYLKDLINSLQKQPQTLMLPETTNEDLENEIKKIIEDKKNAVKKLSNMIIELKKTPSGNMVESPDMPDVEKECKEMMGDLNNMNDKLNNVLLKLRQTPQKVKGEPVKNDDLLNNLNSLKKQCEDEIEALKNQLKSPTELPLVLTGQARVRIDDPDLLKRKYPDSSLPNEPVNIPSNIQFYLYPPHGAPSRTEPAKPYEPITNHQPFEQLPMSRYDPTPESSLKSYRPVDYRPVTPPEVSHIHWPTEHRERLYPEIPSETQSFSPKHKPHSPTSCEACQEDYIPPRTPYRTQEPYVSEKPQHTKSKPPKPAKKGCCGGKGSNTSNIPYEKSPDEEEIMYIHQPHKHRDSKHKKSDHSPPSTSRTPEDSPKPKKKLITKLRPDRR